MKENESLLYEDEDTDIDHDHWENLTEEENENLEDVSDDERTVKNRRDAISDNTLEKGHRKERKITSFHKITSVDTKSGGRMLKRKSYCDLTEGTSVCPEIKRSKHCQSSEDEINTESSLGSKQSDSEDEESEKDYYGESTYY